MLFLILLIPVIAVAALKFFFQREFKWHEAAIQLAATFLAIGIIWPLGKLTVGLDTEILNGAVTGKRSWTFSCPTNTWNPCENGYSCNCHQVPYDCSTTDSKGNRVSQTCYRTECDTCYTYPWERNWYVASNVSSEFKIQRIDAQGAHEPSRWTKTYIGENVSVHHPYKNWVKAAKDSLFHKAARDQERWASLIPNYPISIYDYYRVDRIVTPNVKLSKDTAWNKALSNELAVLGPKKQVNMIFVIVDNVDITYPRAVQRAWSGFKKNDAVVFIGLKNGHVSWVDTISWSKTSIFNIKVNDYVQKYLGQNINSITPDLFMHDIGVITKENYVRRPMKEFEYLKSDIPPPRWLIVLSTILSLGFTIGLGWFFVRNDLDSFRAGSYYNPYRNRF